MSGDPRSCGPGSRRNLALGESYVATVRSMVGGRIFVAFGFADELAVPLLIWLSQEQLPGMP